MASTMAPDGRAQLPQLRRADGARPAVLWSLRDVPGARLSLVRRALGSLVPLLRQLRHAARVLSGGSGPAAGVTPEERKVVTVIFADLSGSTEMATRLDPEDLRGVLRPFFDAMVEEIERFGGTVEKFIGDAVMAVFGVPVAHEDDEERAVRAAFAMQARMEALNREVTERAGGDLDLRVGITGEVLAAHSSHREGYVTGEVVNVAARLQTVAESGAVVVGQRTHDATDATIAYRDLGPFELKVSTNPSRSTRPCRIGGPRRLDGPTHRWWGETTSSTSCGSWWVGPGSRPSRAS